MKAIDPIALAANARLMERRKTAQITIGPVKGVPPRTTAAVGGQEDVTASLVKLAREALEFTAKWREFAKGTQPGRCAVHGVARPLDERESVTESRRASKMVLRFAACPECHRLLHGPPAWIVRAGVPLELAEATLDNWHTRTAADKTVLAAVREFSQRRMGFLVLLGTRGVGKSHLAVGVMDRFRAGVFITQELLLKGMRRHDYHEEGPDWVERCKRTRLLVLDEMGLSAGGRDELPMLHEILDHRHGNFLPTILTANVNQAQFFDIIGERMTDRLTQSMFRIISLAGESCRKQRRAEYGKVAR